MGTSNRQRADIQHILKDLYERRRWLHLVAGALERAAESPEFRLIEAVQEAFEDGYKPMGNLSTQAESLIESLAAKLPNGGREGSASQEGTERVA